MSTGNGPGKGKKRIYLILSGVFAVALLVCVAWLIRYSVGLKQSAEDLEALKDAYVATGPETGPEASSEAPMETGGEPEEKTPEELAREAREALLETYQAPEKDIDFGALQAEENGDIYAWITVPGTPIDYPVLQHPEVADYYLGHNLDGSKGYPGCIYSELYNSREWDDPNTVLYGHNMKNGSMFASLHRFADPEFFGENRYIYIYTEDKIRVYRIFAAYEFSNAHLLLGFDLNDPDNFTSYIGGVLAHDGLGDNIDPEVTVTNEDKLLTLSTCISNKPNNRYLVQAKLVAEG